MNDFYENSVNEVIRELREKRADAWNTFKSLSDEGYSTEAREFHKLHEFFRRLVSEALKIKYSQE